MTRGFFVASVVVVMAAAYVVGGINMYRRALALVRAEEVAS